MVNCPNCGAPIEPYKCKCEFCGTWYFDFTAFDMTEDVPYYVKFRSPQGIITALTKPELQTIELSVDSTDVVDPCGRIIKSFTTSKNCDLNVVFHAVTNPENNILYTIKVENEQKNY